MKKYLTFSIFYILCSLFITQVHAESDENVTRRRPERAVQIQEIRQDRQEDREERREQVQELRSSVAENHANRLERRFKFYFDRLSGIINRFQTRLDTLKASGKDVVATQSKLDTAKSKLAEAKTKGESAVSAFRTIDPAKFSEQKEEAKAARDLAEAARGLFKEVHTLLKDALKSLKAIK
jgi:hypothetical protein